LKEKEEEKDLKDWLLYTIESDMRTATVCVGVVENQDELRYRIRVAYPK